MTLAQKKQRIKNQGQTASMVFGITMIVISIIVLIGGFIGAAHLDGII